MWVGLNWKNKIVLLFDVERGEIEDTEVIRNNGEGIALVIRKTPNKIAMQYYFPPTRWKKFKNSDGTKCWPESTKSPTLIHCWQDYR